MRKSLSLMLAAALTVSSALSSVAAPLAKKDCARPTADGKAVAVEAKAAPARALMMAPAKSFASKSLKGVAKLNTPGVAKKRHNALKSATAAQRAVASTVNLRGSLIWVGSWEDAEAPEYGMYTIPTTTAGSFDLIGQTTSDPISLGYEADGVYYACYDLSFWGMHFTTVTAYDAETFQVIWSSDCDVNLAGTDCAVDPTTGDVYGQTYNADGTALAWSKLDYETLSGDVICDMNIQLAAVGCDKEGQFYAVDLYGMLYSVDKATGALTEIAQTEAVTDYLVSGCINDDNHTFLMSLNTDADGGQLVEIDLTDGTVTVLANYDDDQEIVALYIAKPAAADKAPAAPEITVTNDGSMDVVVNLTLPTTLFDGTPLAEGTQLDYTVTANGTEILTGTAAAGATVTETVTLAQGGKVKFVASVSNTEGESPKAKTEAYVGTGTPSAPRNVVLSWVDGVATLSWDAVTTSSDGGYFNAEDGVTYTVSDLEGNAVVSDLTETTTTIDVEEPENLTSLYYTVTATYKGKTSAATQSNTVILGNIVPAYTGTFDASTWGYYAVVDANGDNKTWTLNGSFARYSYSSSNDADDWLITPSIKLEAGKVYPVTAVVNCQSLSYPERMEIMAGKGFTPADLTTEVVPATDVDDIYDMTLSGVIIPTETGLMNIGFHAISEADNFYINFKSWTIGKGFAATAPVAPANINVKPAVNGDLKAAISFKAPSTAFNGNALTGNVTVNVKRNGVVVKTVTGKAGANYSISDVVPERGNYTYSFTATNAAGEEGIDTNVTVYVGPKTPLYVTDVNAYESNGTVNISWTAPTKDVDGGDLLPENLTYNVYTLDESGAMGDKINSQPITATEYSFTDDSDVQDFKQYAIQSVNRNVEGQVNYAFCPVGPAYAMPMVIDELDDLSNYILIFGSSDYGNLLLGNSETLNGVEAPEGEEYFIINSQYTKQYVDMYFGKTHVDGDKPEFTFYTYGVVGEDGTPSANLITVTATVDGVATELLSSEVSELAPEDEWGKVTVDLSDYKGKDVMISLRGDIVNFAYTLLDRFAVEEALTDDLKAASIAAPASVETDAEFDVTVNVKNLGTNAAEGAAVNLYRNGDVYATQTIDALASGETVAVIFTDKLGLHDGTNAEYSAEVVYDADLNTANNTTKSVVVARKQSKMPTVTGLTGAATENGHELTWDAIDLGQPQPTVHTEDFENVESWAQEIEGWTFLDVDGAAQGGFQNVNIPGINPGVSTGSFFVWDTASLAISNCEANSGTKFLAALFRYDDGQVDDWAISPKLAPVAQKISFWAKSYSATYPETIEVMISYEDSVDPNDYESASRQFTLGAEWTLIEIEVDEDVKHFAIHSFASSSWMLMIDDITYTSLDGIDAEHIGYNVYCDGVKLNNELVTENSFVNTQPTGAHTYHVTAVYDKGESEISAPCTVENSGLAITKAGQLKVNVDGKTIVVAGTEGKQVTIATADGKVIYSAAGDARVAATSAVYLVTVNGRTAKVIVR